MATRQRFRCVHCGFETPLDAGGSPDIRCPSCRAVFPVESGVVVLTSDADEDDYPEHLIELVARVEERHFWFAARNDVIVSTMRRAIGALSGKQALDVGCGTGFVLAALERAGLDACGIDMHRTALTHARARVRGPLVLSQATTLPFFPDFDVVTLCDVIEHIADDVGMLREAGRALAPNGHLVVTVPADPRLWTSYDKVIGHKRRYDRHSLVHVLELAGFDVNEVGYFNCLPYAGQIVQRRMATGPDSGLQSPLEIVGRSLRVPPRPVNALLRLSVLLEAPLRRLSWVRGGSLIAICQPRYLR